MAVAHCRIELQGTLSSNRDIWSTSFSTTEQSDLVNTASLVNAAWLDAVWTHGTSNAIWPTVVSFAAVRASNINAAGHVTATYTSTENLPAFPVGTSNQVPPECAVVCSLVTATAGASHRGRMYLPPVDVAQLDQDGQLQSGSAANIADAMKRFLDAVNDGLSLGNVAVFSRTLGVLTDVTQIRVGRTMDAQRRRRNKIPESYTNRTLA
jgi:hypothetical protein